MHTQSKTMICLRKMLIEYKPVQASRASSSFIDGIEIVILLVDPFAFFVR